MFLHADFRKEGYMSDNKIKIPQLCYYQRNLALRFSLVPNTGYNIRMCLP